LFLLGLPDFLIGYFTGCIRDVTFNNQSVTFINSSTSQPGVHIRSSVDVQVGYPARDVCSNVSRCSCRPGWSGCNCSQSIDDFMSGPCLNNSTCIDRHMSYNCICDVSLARLCCEVLRPCTPPPLPPSRRVSMRGGVRTSTTSLTICARVTLNYI